MMFPKMIVVKQKIRQTKLQNYLSSIRSELRRAKLHEKVRPGSRIAITAGSRGISHYPEILATVVDEVKKAGGQPFLFPAMGSHGGATPEGQIRVLKALNICPETTGAPIYSSLEVDEIGKLDNSIPVYVDRIALQADGVIVVNRVKPHTDFKGQIESGLMKMLAIGLGKQKGAEMIHWHQSEGYHKLISAAANLIMEKVSILLGLAIVENAYREIAIVKAFEPKEIEQGEMRLLKKAKKLLARLPFKDIDVLVVDEIGKEISGTGMDTNVTGRFWIPGEKDPLAPKIKRIVILDLSIGTHGNAAGIGLADITTKRVFDKIDYSETFANCLTQGSTETPKIPVFLPNDRDAIAAALRTCAPIDPRKAKMIRIKNTLELERFWISESLAEIVQSDRKLSQRVELLSEPREMQFDVLGTLAR